MGKKVNRNLSKGVNNKLSQIDNLGMNIIERTKQVNQISQDVYKKICLETMTAQRERELVAQAEAGMFAVFSRCLLNDWNALRIREQRLNVMYHKCKEYLDALEQPCAEQIKAEIEFCKQTGFKMTRANNPEEVLARVDPNTLVDMERLDNIAIWAGESESVEVCSETLICMINEIKRKRQNKE